MTDTKTCTKCSVILPATKEYFYWHKGRNAPYARCKSCIQKYGQENKERRQIRYKEYYHKNKEKICASRKEYRQEHMEEVSEYAKKYATSSWGRFMRCKTNKKHLWKISWADYQKLIGSKPQQCYYCDIPEESWHKLHCHGKKNIKYLTLDRRDPKGFYEIDNIELCCLSCNTGKSDLYTPEEWMRIAQMWDKPAWQKELGIQQ